MSGVFDVWPAACAPSVNIDNLLGVSNEGTARELSPQWLLDERAVSIPAHWRVSVVYGEFDPPEFCAQSEEFRAALAARGVREHFGGVVAGKDHFDVMEDMRYADDATGSAFRAVIG